MEKPRHEPWKSERIASESVLDIPQVLANPAVQDMIQRKTEVRAELADERVRHLDDHPTLYL